MKPFLIVILILGVGYFTWNALQTAPSETIPKAVVSDTTIPLSENEMVEGAKTEVVSFFDNENIAVSYTGFGPGKEHKGTLAVQSADLMSDEQGKVTGSVSVDMNSITADVPAVATHLKSKDFFNASAFPIATFTIKDITPRKTTCTGVRPELQATSTCLEYYASGSFTLRGVTKDISFPVIKTETSYSTEFRIVMKDFGIVQKFANDEFVVRVLVPLKK